MTVPTTPQLPMAEHACAYTALGWHLFKLVTGSKFPYKGTHGFKDATSDCDALRATWAPTPDANIALATGRISGVVVLDIDPRSGGDASLAQALERFGPLPETAEQTTAGGGRHFLFAYPESKRVSSGSLKAKGYPGIDIKADGGYALLAPSSVGGRPYRWVDSCDPRQAQLAPLPGWVLEVLYTRAENHAAPLPPGEALDARRSWLGAAFHAAGWMGELVLRNDAGEVGKRKVLCPWRGGHSQKGKDYDSSAVLHAPTPGRTMGWFHCSHGSCQERELPDVLAALPPDAKAAADVEFPRRKKPRAGAPAPAPAGGAPSETTPGGEPIETPPPVGAAVLRLVPRTLAPLVRGSQAELAERVLAQLETGPLTWDEGEFWRYEAPRGIWDKLSAEQVERCVMSFDGVGVRTGGDPKPLRVSQPMVKGTALLARVLLVTRPSPATFASPRAGVAFKNGFVTLNEKHRIVLAPHAPEHRTRHAFDFDYNPRAGRAGLLEFLDDVFADCSEDERASRIACLQEFIGAALLGHSTQYQKALVLRGYGGNGKSQILAIAEAVFPPGTTCSISPHEWGHQFRSALLVGKRANFVNEIPKTDIASSNVFKAVIAGEKIIGEHKNRPPFEFAPRAGHIFSANELPSTRDKSEGFFRRFVVLPLTREFDKSEDRILDLGKLLVARELPGIIAWVLEGGARRARQSDYTTSEQSRTELDRWREESDHVRVFLSQFRGLGGSIRATAFYSNYRTWCAESGFTPLTNITFWKNSTTTGLVSRHEDGQGSYYRPTSVLTALFAARFPYPPESPADGR